jgi:hypothetical protein
MMENGWAWIMSGGSMSAYFGVIPPTNADGVFMEVGHFDPSQLLGLGHGLRRGAAAARGCRRSGRRALACAALRFACCAQLRARFLEEFV